MSMQQKPTTVAKKGSNYTRPDEVVVKLGSGPYTRGHKLPKWNYNADTHETSFIRFSTKLREVNPACSTG